jgi:hypothetical protein
MAKDEPKSCQAQVGCQKDGCKNSDRGEQHVKYLKRKIYLVLFFFWFRGCKHIIELQVLVYQDL